MTHSLDLPFCLPALLIPSLGRPLLRVLLGSALLLSVRLHAGTTGQFYNQVRPYNSWISADNANAIANCRCVNQCCALDLAFALNAAPLRLLCVALVRCRADRIIRRPPIRCHQVSRNLVASRLRSPRRSDVLAAVVCICRFWQILSTLAADTVS